MVPGMALPRRGTRRITVDGQPLRWLVTTQAEQFTLLVEHHDAPGQRLVARLSKQLFPEDARVVSPEVARQAIVYAQARGFDPGRPGGELRLSVPAEALDLGRVDREALTKRPVGRPRKRAPGEKRRPVYVSLEAPDRERLTELAEARGVALGTLAKDWILERLAEEEGRDAG